MAAGFDFRQRLGSGNFGEVWLVTDTGLDAERALKLIPPDKVLNPQNFFHEAQLLKSVEHPNIVRVHETGKMSDGRLYVAMEYLPKGSLEDEAKGSYVPLTRAKRMIIDVLRGLEYAHSKGVIHRDIKPANILVGKSNEGKLSDFGLAITTGLNLKALGVKDYAYTLHLAPEVAGPNDYNELTDIYACGVTLYRLVNGDSLLPAIAPLQARTLALQGKFPNRSYYRDFVPRPLRMVINKAIGVDPKKRFQSAEQMRHALEQVAIEKNWSETTRQNGTEWTCGWNKKVYRVTRSLQPDGKWSVDVRKGASKKALRRVTALSSSGLTKAKADQLSRRVLQDFVLGKAR